MELIWEKNNSKTPQQQIYPRVEWNVREGVLWSYTRSYPAVNTRAQTQHTHAPTALVSVCVRVFFYYAVVIALSCCTILTALHSATESIWYWMDGERLLLLGRLIAVMPLRIFLALVRFFPPLQKKTIDILNDRGRGLDKYYHTIVLSKHKCSELWLTNVYTNIKQINIAIRFYWKIAEMKGGVALINSPQETIFRIRKGRRLMKESEGVLNRILETIHLSKGFFKYYIPKFACFCNTYLRKFAIWLANLPGNKHCCQSSTFRVTPRICLHNLASKF